MNRLEGKVAVITGAGSGIGAATARLFAAEGAAVVVADLNEDGGKEVVRQCRDGGRATFVRADVTKEEDVQAMIAAARGEYGRVDVLFNNAGVGGAIGRIHDTLVEDWDRTFAVLVRGVFLGIKHVILPEQNRAEWSEVPAEVRGKITVHFVRHVSELLPLALRDK